jgi:malonyl-CoA decarboxylase
LWKWNNTKETCPQLRFSINQRWIGAYEDWTFHALNTTTVGLSGNIMKSLWLEKVIDSVADRGRELLKLRGNGAPPRNIEYLCRSLISEKGEASGTALAREVITEYCGGGAEGRLAFFEMLHATFGYDEIAIIDAADRFKSTRNLDDYLELAVTIQPDRQELFRRINIAPNGPQAVVAMRSDLLGLLDGHPRLQAVDEDLRQLLAMWFNRGFLNLRRIDWRTSAVVLEKLIQYESVHAIQSWADLQRRLEADRRCFAFFHPALPEDPLIFVEAALVKGMSDTIAPLLDVNAPVLAPGEADSVIFYSINNCLDGLKGISFGNFLIKQVTTELAREFPGLRMFSTLSPMPLFSCALQDAQMFTDERLRGILGEDARNICDAAAEIDLRYAVTKLLSEPQEHGKLLTRAMKKLGLAYLTCARIGTKLLDPVACFHLSNGARLERINVFANSTRQGIQESKGLMVNYRYVPEEFESNHEAFVKREEIPVSKALAKDFKSVAVAWSRSDEVTASAVQT